MTAAAILARFPRPRLQPPRWSSGGIDGATFNLAPDAAAFLRVLAGNPEPWPPPSESTHWIIWPVNDHQPRRELEERLRAFVVRVGLALGNYTLTSTDREVRLAVNPGVAVDDGKWEAEWL